MLLAGWRSDYSAINSFRDHNIMIKRLEHFFVKKKDVSFSSCHIPDFSCDIFSIAKIFSVAKYRVNLHLSLDHLLLDCLYVSASLYKTRIKILKTMCQMFGHATLLILQVEKNRLAGSVHESYFWRLRTHGKNGFWGHFFFYLYYYFLRCLSTCGVRPIFLAISHPKVHTFYEVDKGGLMDGFRVFKSGYMKL